jgi:hypothetical protein
MISVREQGRENQEGRGSGRRSGRIGRRWGLNHGLLLASTVPRYCYGVTILLAPPLPEPRRGRRGWGIDNFGATLPSTASFLQKYPHHQCPEVSIDNLHNSPSPETPLLLREENLRFVPPSPFPNSTFAFAAIFFLSPAARRPPPMVARQGSRGFLASKIFTDQPVPTSPIFAMMFDSAELLPAPYRVVSAFLPCARRLFENHIPLPREATMKLGCAR